MSKLLTESSISAVQVDEDGTIPIVLITPGKGTSGYYTEDLIKRDAASAWPAGSHSYINHLQAGEVRNPEKLIGTLTEDAHWSDEKGGAVSRLRPLKHWREFVDEVAPHTGLSISAMGDGKLGEMDGEEVFIVESLSPSIQNTIDLVSFAGRGGYVESLLESAHASTHVETSAGDKEKETKTMADEAKLDQLISTVEALVTTITAERDARIAEAAGADTKTADAVKAVDATKAVESADITASAKAKLIEGIKAGTYDVAPLIEAAKTEKAALLAEVLQEQAALGATAGSGSGPADLTVKGW